MKKIFASCVIVALALQCLNLSFPPQSHAENLKEISLEGLFKEHVDSVVLIGSMYKKKNRLGTGFIVSDNGLIVTNAHLVKPSQKIIVKLHGAEIFHPAELISVDKKKDIALLKVDLKDLPAVRMGNSGGVQIGQRVVTIGNPLGLESSIADGLISSWRDFSEGFKMLQISVPLSEGSSGGPLFDLDGKVVGMTTSSSEKGQNLNFAVPVNDIKSFLSKTKYKSLFKARSSKNLAGASSGSEKSRDVPLSSDALLSTKKAQSSSPNFSSAPVSSSSAKSKSTGRLYIVKSGDTLYALARRFKTTVQALTQNNALPTTTIHPGQSLIVPPRR